MINKIYIHQHFPKMNATELSQVYEFLINYILIKTIENMDEGRVVELKNKLENNIKYYDDFENLYLSIFPENEIFLKETIDNFLKVYGQK